MEKPIKNTMILIGQDAINFSKSLENNKNKFAEKSFVLDILKGSKEFSKLLK